MRKLLILCINMKNKVTKESMLNKKIKSICFLLILIINPILEDVMATELKPPIAKKEVYIHETHGDKRVDHYHWLRDKNWPKVTNKEILSYLKAENNYTEQYLDRFKNSQEIFYKEIVARIKEDDQTYPIEDGGYFYYSRSVKDQNFSISCRKKSSMSSPEEIILDPNKLAKGHPAFSMSAMNISPDHSLLAYSTDLKGEERYKIYIKDLATSSVETTNIDNTIGNIIWHEVEKGFFYTKLDDSWRARKIYYHRLGDDTKNDKLIYHEKSETFTVGIDRSSDKKYLFIHTGDSTQDEVWFLDLTKEDFTPKIMIPRKNDQLYSVDHKNGDFYYVINDQGKNFRLVRTDITNLTNQDMWHELVPHSDHIYLTGVDFSKDYMVVNRRVNGINQITIFDNSGNHKKVAFEEQTYSASGYFPTYESSLLRISYSSMTTPGSLLEYDYPSETKYVRKTQEIPSGYDKEMYHSERIHATATDGTMVPISLVYKKDLFKKDGSNPLYLYGYGSYGISISPSFNSSIISLLDRGFIFAIAHIRGGDDLGFNWYESAKFLNKELTFTDFISSAEHLINLKYTSKNSLVISGGSAGGMLVGTVINKRPELFKVAIARVPFVDVLNTMLDETLPLTPGEYKEWGNPQDKSFYEYIKSYSPYDNVKNAAYPAIFVTAGLTDPRVTYWEPAKWVAKLREHNQSTNPILLYTEMESGHQGQNGRYLAIREVAKIYSFICSILDIPIEKIEK